MKKDFYDEKFYKTQAEGSYKSAKEIIKLIYKFYKPDSVIDVGCGVGTWLKAFEEQGCGKVHGIDGNNIDDKFLYVSRKNIEISNLDTYSNKSNDKYDLAISLEVAEHLKPENSENFVKLLCSFSDVVLFSAAILYQGGTNHINLQSMLFWVKLFNDNGYECFDPIRNNIYYNDNVEFWYSQNILLFVKKEKTKDFEEKGLIINNVPMMFYHVKHFEYILYLLKEEKRKTIYNFIKRKFYKTVYKLSFGKTRAKYKKIYKNL